MKRKHEKFRTYTMSSPEMLKLLHQALAEHNCEQVSDLTKAGVDVNTIYERETACTKTIKETCNKFNVTEILDILLSSENFVSDSMNMDEETPLYVAAKRGHNDVVKMLVSRGCDVNKSCVNNETPLMVAVRNSRNKIVEYLCKNGACVNNASRTGETALYIACDSVNLNAVKCLLANGADVNIQTNSSHPRTNHTPLMASIPTEFTVHIQKKPKSDSIAIMKLLLSGGCDVNARFWNDNTALHIAQEYNDVHAVCVLAQNGLDLHVKNKFGVTAFEDAIQPKKQMYEVAYALLMLGYNIDKVQSKEHSLITLLRGFNPKESRYTSHFTYISHMRHQLVCHLKECVTYDQELYDKIKERITSFPDETQMVIDTSLRLSDIFTPRSLKQMCRTVIRKSIRHNMLYSIWKLPLPTEHKQYLAFNLNPNRDPVKYLDLLLAIKESNTEQVNELVNSNIDLNYSFIDHTPLTYAVKTNNLEVCKLLITCGADVNVCDKLDMLPKHWTGNYGMRLLTEEIMFASNV